MKSFHVFEGLRQKVQILKSLFFICFELLLSKGASDQSLSQKSGTLKSIVFVTIIHFLRGRS